MCALAPKRDLTDGWVEWEKKHAKEIGLTMEHMSDIYPPVNQQNASGSNLESDGMPSPPP